MSDHSQITIQIDFSPNKRGKGTWKFNNLRLQDPKFLELINELIQEFKWNTKNREEAPLDVQ